MARKQKKSSHILMSDERRPKRRRVKQKRPDTEPELQLLWLCLCFAFATFPTIALQLSLEINNFATEQDLRAYLAKWLTASVAMLGAGQVMQITATHVKSKAASTCRHLSLLVTLAGWSTGLISTLAFAVEDTGHPNAWFALAYTAVFSGTAIVIALLISSIPRTDNSDVDSR